MDGNGGSIDLSGIQSITFLFTGPASVFHFVTIDNGLLQSFKAAPPPSHAASQQRDPPTAQQMKVKRFVGHNF